MSEDWSPEALAARQRWLDKIAARVAAVLAGALFALGVIVAVRDTVAGGLVLIVCSLAIAGVGALLETWANE